jgi:hypothetical protein
MNGKGGEGSGNALIWGTNPAFACKDYNLSEQPVSE